MTLPVFVGVASLDGVSKDGVKLRDDVRSSDPVSVWRRRVILAESETDFESAFGLMLVVRLWFVVSENDLLIDANGEGERLRDIERSRENVRDAELVPVFEAVASREMLSVSDGVEVFVVEEVSVKDRSDAVLSSDRLFVDSDGVKVRTATAVGDGHNNASKATT